MIISEDDGKPAEELAWQEEVYAFAWNVTTRSNPATAQSFCTIEDTLQRMSAISAHVYMARITRRDEVHLHNNSFLGRETSNFAIRPNLEAGR